MASEPTLSQSAYAKRRGWSQQYVSQLVRAGKIPTTNGKIDPSLADAALAAIREPTRQAVVDENARRRGQAGPAELPPVGPPPDSDAPSVARARIARETIAAKREHMQYMKEVGELVERKRYEKALLDAFGPIVSKLGTIPGRVCREVTEEEARRVQVAVDKIVGEVRDDVAQAMRTLAMSAAGHTRQ